MLEIIVLIISIVNLVQQYEIEKLKIVAGSLIGKVFLNQDLDANIEIRYDGKVIK